MSHNFMLKTFFKPKWQHADSQLRKKAILELSIDDSQPILLQIAKTDPVEELRQLATEKLTDSSMLLNLLEQADTAAEWCRFATRLNQLRPQSEELANQFKQKRLSWDQKDEVDAIAQLMDLELAQILLLAIDDEKVLFEMVLTAKSIELRLNTIEKINDLNQLQQLLKQLSHKSLLRLVKDKISQVKQQQKQQQDLQEQAERLINSIAKLSQQSWFDPQFEPKVQQTINHWQKLLAAQHQFEQSLFDITQFDAEFKRYADLCKQTIEQNRQAMEQAAMEKDASNKQLELCHQLEKLQLELQSSASNFDSVQSIITAQVMLDDNWQQTVQLVKPQTETKNRYQQVTNQLQQGVAAWHRLTDIESEIQALIGKAFLLMASKTSIEKPEVFEQLSLWIKTNKQVFSQVDWPDNLAKPEFLSCWIETTDKVKQRWDQLASQQKKLASQVHHKLRLLEKHCQQRNLIAANKLINYLSKISTELSADFRQSYVDKLESITPKLDELRDWHAFATEPKKEALCTTMESLIGSSLEPLEIARQVRQLQSDWHELIASDVTADEQLWDRFKQASDLAYQPCLAYYAEKDQQKAENLKQREQICGKLKQLYDLCLSKSSTDPQQQNKLPDWKQIERSLKQYEQQWKQYNPVPDNERQIIQRQFNRHYKNIKQQINAYKQQNLQIREELVNKARRLLDIENISQAINQAIHLQKEWQQVGITFFKSDREQWKLFRSALDKVFAKRDAINQSVKAQQQDNLVQLVELTDKINQLCQLNDDQLKLSYGQFKEFKDHASKLNDFAKNKEKKALDDFRLACSRFQTHFDGISFREQQRQLDSLLLLAEKIQQIEECLMQSSNITIEQKELDFVDQSCENINCEQSIKDAIQGRINFLKDPRTKKENQPGLLKLQKLLLDTEIAFDLESPDEFKQQRMTVQLQKLQENGVNQAVKLNKAAAIFDFLSQWFEVGFVPSKSRESLEKRRIKLFQAAGFN